MPTARTPLRRATRSWCSSTRHLSGPRRPVKAGPEVRVEIAVGTVIDDRYEVLGRIGSGAVAVVYVARHTQLGSLHAVKVLLVPTRFVQERLLKEGRLQGALRGPNVVTVTDVVDIEGAPGLVMEFVRGPSLDRLLQHLQFEQEQAVAVGAGILLGVRAAHQVGMVH